MVAVGYGQRRTRNRGKKQESFAFREICFKKRRSSTYLDWVNIVGNDDKFCLLLLDEGVNVVETELNDGFLWFLFTTFFCGFISGLFALFSVQWLVFCKDFEKNFGTLFVQCVVKLVDWCWNLNPFLEEGFPALSADVQRPFYKPSQISLWLKVVANRKVLWARNEQVFVVTSLSDVVTRLPGLAWFFYTAFSTLLSWSTALCTFTLSAHL
mmetsp:Transcript_1884/g.2076  ORF Transcript_1884/g.2076 Transcript_1884/m.2076 type:complete len:211 (-) Transcript_1884:15-647(-)